MRPSKAEAERYQLLGYRPIPILPNTKVPSGPGWAKTSLPLLTAEDIRSTAWPGGVGIRCGVGDAHVVGVDVDIDHPVIAQEILRTLRKIYGDVAYRVGAAPRLLVPMRTLEGAPVARGSPKYTLATGETCCIDILGAGKQFVAHGIHPTTGQAYVWRGGLPRAVELPVWTEEVAGQLREALADAVEEFGGAIAGQKKPPADGEGGGGGRICGVSRREVARLMQALYQIPSTDGKTWREVGFALHAEYCGSAEGLHVWIAWSMDYAGPREGGQTCAQECARRWAKMRPDGGVQGGTIYHLAKLHAKLHVAAEEVAAPGVAQLDSVATAEDDDLYRCWKVSELAGQPLPTYVIDGWVPAGEVALMSGKEGSGKSFLALDMAMSVARGIPWAGAAVKQGKVIYITAEDAKRFTPRVYAYCAHHGIEVESLDDVFRQVVQAPVLTDSVLCDKLAAKLRQQAPVSLIILDTFGASIAGADENSSKDMGLVLAELRKIVSATAAAILVVTHVGKDETRGVRGSSRIRTDTHVDMRVVNSAGPRKVALLRNRSGLEGLEVNFHLDAQDALVTCEGAVATVKTCVVVYDASIVATSDLPWGAAASGLPWGAAQTRAAACWEGGISEAEWVRRIMEADTTATPTSNKRQNAQRVIRGLKIHGMEAVG